MTKFQLVSDIHADVARKTDFPEIECAADTLIVAGDIAVNTNRFRDTLYRLSSRFDNVAYTLGNHDIWAPTGGSSRTIHEVKNLQIADNIKPLDAAPYYVNDVAIVGVMGWYDYSGGDASLEKKYGIPFKRMTFGNSIMADLLHVRWDDPAQGRNLTDPEISELQITKLRTHLEGASNKVGKIIVATHIPPRPDLLIWKEGGGKEVETWNFFNAYFSNPHIDELIREFPAVKVCVYGHTHRRSDRTIDGIRYIVNPFGYPRENSRHETTTFEI